MRIPEPARAVPAAFLPAAYSLLWTAGALREGFTHDDLTNLYRALFSSWSELLRAVVEIWRPTTVFRPAGEILYRLLWETAGFNLLPYHAACLALYLAGVMLAFAVARNYLSGSILFALPAAWLLAYHKQFWNLYSNAGTIFDLLANFFYLGALWLAGWKPGRRGAPARIILILIAALCSLNSKETAASLAFALLVIMIANAKAGAESSRLRAFLSPADAACIVAVGAMTAVWAGERVLAASGITAASGYGLEFSLDRIGGNWAHFVSRLAGSESGLHPAFGLAAFTLPLALFLWMRAWTSVLAWLAAGVSFLPLAFIPKRGLDAHFLPVFWVALAAAAALQRATAHWKRPAAAPLAAIIALVAWHGAGGGAGFPVFGEESAQIRLAYPGIAAAVKGLPHNGHVAFIEDHFEEKVEWASTTMVLLALRRDDLFVLRAKEIASGQGLPDPSVIVDVALKVTASGVRICRAPDGTALTVGRIRRAEFVCGAD